MKNDELLAKIGLNKKESNIYLSLLENGGMTVARISHVSGINRPAIYKLLPNLQKLGLVVITPQGKQKRYVAESPKKLKLLIDELKDSLLEAMPDLETTYEGRGYKPIVKFFMGKEGIGQVFMDVVNSLDRKETYYRYTTSIDLEKISRYMPKDFKIVKDRKQLESVIISNSEASKDGPKWINQVVKVMPSEFDVFNYEITMYVYGEKISFIDFNTETAIIVENKKIAEFQKNLFRLIYRKI